MPTATPSLTSEIQQLRDDLRVAELARVTDADRKASEIRQQLQRKEAELQAAQEAEGLAIAEQQHDVDLLTLVQLENDIAEQKAEVNTLRTMLNELPGRLSRSQWQLDQLLRSHAQLKADLKG